MHKNNFYISFGIWIAILPFLGIPGFWRNTLVTLSGIFLALVFAGPIILKKLQFEAKPKRKKGTTISNNPDEVNRTELKFSDSEKTDLNNNIQQEIDKQL